MSERFRLIRIDDYVFQIKDIDNDLYLVAEQICNLLNEQQATIITLKSRLEKINGGYGYLTHRNGLTANEWLIESQERELKKKNEQISDWIERHSKDIVKISEQQATINELEETNKAMYKRLKEQSEIIYQLIQKLKEHMTEKELKELMEGWGL